MDRRTFLSGLAAALVAANAVLGFRELEPEPEVEITNADSWNRVLTDEEITAYHAGLALPLPERLIYWRKFHG